MITFANVVYETVM